MRKSAHNSRFGYHTLEWFTINGKKVQCLVWHNGNKLKEDGK
jgi:hypothetical protein